MSATTSFDYSDKITGTTNGTVSIPTADAPGWEAKSKVALNSCNKQSTWTLKVKAKTSGNGLEWTPEIANASGTASDCEVLTPRFNDFH